VEPWPVESFAPSRAGVLDDSAVAFSGFLAHISDHSKAFVDWNSEDVFLLTIIPMISEGSSVLSEGVPSKLYISHLDRE
jgi:hypothetical protein